MHPKTIALQLTSNSCDLQSRTHRFRASVQAMCEAIAPCPQANRMVSRLLKAACDIASCYEAASRSRSRDEFIDGISVVASHTRKARRLLRLLLDSGHVRIEDARDVMWETRALVAIFERSATTAKRRRSRAAASRPTRPCGNRP